MIIYREISCWPIFFLYEIRQYYLEYSCFHPCLKIKNWTSKNKIHTTKLQKIGLFYRILEVGVPNQVYKIKYEHHKQFWRSHCKEYIWNKGMLLPLSWIFLSTLTLDQLLRTTPKTIWCVCIILHYKSIITSISFVWSIETIIKAHYWIISYVCVARIAPHQNPGILRRVMVFIHPCLRDTLQMVWFLLQISLVGLYPWSLYPSGRWEGVRGVVVLHIRIKLWKTRGRGGYKWVSLCWCARFNLGTRYLLRQAQYEAQLPVQFPSLQGTWDSSSVEHPGVRTHNCYCDTVFNPTFNMQNGFIHFRGHDSTQSGKYDLGLLAYHPINREEKRRKIVPLLIAMLSLIVLLDFFSLR